MSIFPDQFILKPIDFLDPDFPVLQPSQDVPATGCTDIDGQIISVCHFIQHLIFFVLYYHLFYRIYSPYNPIIQQNKT